MAETTDGGKVPATEPATTATTGVAASTPKPGEDGYTASLVKRLEKLEADNAAMSAKLAQGQVTSARDRFVGEKMKDLPQAYRDLMPATDDPAKLAQAEQQVRDRFKSELGDKLPKVADTTTGGGGQGAKPRPDPGTAYSNITKGLASLGNARPHASRFPGEETPPLSTPGK